MAGLTDPYTREAVENMLMSWYGKKMEVNDKVILIVYQMIEESAECTSSIDKVPYKIGGVTGVVGKLSSITIATIKRVVLHAGKDQYYIMCLRSEARTRRFQIELAAMGQ